MAKIYSGSLEEFERYLDELVLYEADKEIIWTNSKVALDVEGQAKILLVSLTRITICCVIRRGIKSNT